MKRQSLHALLVISIVLLAGCSGGVTAGPEPPATEIGPSGTQGTDANAETTADGSPATPSSDQAATASNGGTVAFYISDEENAIGDFQQLEVTVTRVGFERASAEGGGWVEFEVDGETADLTELQGDNATLVDEFDVPNGDYGKVFVHVSEVNATLEDGTQVNVKLPSEKLQIKQPFIVDNDSQVDFVFDITVHEAGQSGKYILTPVVGESGTDVPIDEVRDQDERDGLTIELIGNVSQGGNATVQVTHEGSSVGNATVSVDETEVGATDADGRLTFDLPNNDTVQITVTKGDAAGELELEFEDGDEDVDDDDVGGEDVEAALNATFVTDVTEGENATIQVTRNGTAVENATITVNDEPAGTTDAAGELTFAVPEEDTLTVVVVAGDDEVELEREIGSDGSA